LKIGRGPTIFFLAQSVRRTRGGGGLFLTITNYINILSFPALLLTRTNYQKQQPCHQTLDPAKVICSHFQVTKYTLSHCTCCKYLYMFLLFVFIVNHVHVHAHLIVNTSRSFPHSRLITGFVTRLTRRVPLVELELLTLPEHLSLPPVFSGVRVIRSLVLCVCLQIVVCPFVLFLLAIVLSVLRYTDSLVSSNYS